MSTAKVVVADIIAEFDVCMCVGLIDDDKRNYSMNYDVVLVRVSEGGIIQPDEVLCFGKDVEPVDPKDTDTIALLEFNRKLLHDPRIEVVLLPIRDGLSLARKINLSAN